MFGINPLSTRVGRQFTFFMLYLTEGIPLGFTATAVATQMRRQGLGPAEIGAFVGSLYLPWAFKWLAGPIVDTLTVRRMGPRRFWILIMQLGMIASLFAAMPVNFGTQLQLFTAIVFVHNMFGATQDVAIDALAVNVLPEEERGTANGFMFGGAYLGQALGGGGVLFLTPLIGFSNTFLVVAAWIAAVTVFVVLPMREPMGPEPLGAGDSVSRRAAGDLGGARRNGPSAFLGAFQTFLAAAGPALRLVAGDILGFMRDALRAFLGSRAALVGVLFALLPGGAYALGLALQSNLAVELGMDDGQVGALNLWSSVISGIFCVVGGWLSDRFGRRGTLAWTMAATAIPTLMLAMNMREHGWIMSVPAGTPDRPAPPAALLQMFWASVLVYNVFQGLYYGIRSALFMDVTTPRVAATQFTGYMALMNLAIAYSAAWQGWAIEHWGYPLTLTADAVFGLVCLACLPFMKPVSPAKRRPAPGAAVPEAIEP